MRNSLLRWAFAWLFICSITMTWSQNPTPNQEFKPQEVTLPKSPEVNGMFNHSPFPVDHSSGSVNIDIPLYTINSGRIQLPISASYHTGGIRVQDIAGMIGLGWNLNFGYSIRVSEDETKIYPYSYKQYKNEIAALAATNRGNLWMEEMVNSADGYYPSGHTIYDFNCGSFSGAFYYDDNQQLQFLSPDDNIKVVPINYAETAALMGGFKITTNDGIEYVFDKRETTIRQEQSYPGPTLQTTAFLVSKITDLISGDQVNFTYNQKEPYSVYQNDSNLGVYRGTYPDDIYCPWSGEGSSFRSIPFQVKSLQIASISFTGGHINFISANDRLDMDKTRVTDINIYSDVAAGSIMKNIKFNQSYFVSAGNITKYNYRLRLDSLVIQSNGLDTADKNTYKFEYESTTLPAYRSSISNLDRNSLQVDYWGFYNGTTGGTGLIPKKILQEFFASNGLNKPLLFTTDRSANSLYTKACALTKVTYPTGGYAQFTYENHQFSGHYLGNTLGGLRINNISYFADKDDVRPIQTSFNYLSAKQLSPVYFDSFFYSKTKAYMEQYGNTAEVCIVPYLMYYISSDPNYAFVYHHGSPVFYDKVEEYKGTPVKNEGKTIYTFNFTNTDHNDYTLSSIKEYAGRKLVHTNDWTRGQLLSKEVFKKNTEGAGPYILILKEVNSYKAYNKGWVKLGIMISKNDQASGYVGSNVLHRNSNSYSWDLVGPYAKNYYTDESYHGRMPVDAFVYNDISILRSYLRLSKQETYRYEGTDNLYTATDYYYDSPYHEQVTKQETSDSYGNINTRNYYYVQDQNAIADVNINESGTAFPLLMQNNKVSDIIQEDRLINGNLQLRKRAKYIFRQNYTLGKNIPLIQDFITTNYNSQGVAIQNDDIRFNKYDDHSLLLEQQDGEGILRSYIWDDAGINLLANATNAAYADICQTSFENGGRGKWIYNGVPAFDASAVTGNNSYTLTGSYTVGAAGLTASREYVVSYWSSNGAYTVSGTIGTTEGRTLGVWKYYEHRVTGVSGLTISGSGKLDEVRLFPKDAQMTSFTNIPMIGTNSICDPNGKILYYSYDGLGRLMLIRDLDKNVVQRICYKFYDQPEDCTESYN